MWFVFKLIISVVLLSIQYFFYREFLSYGRTHKLGIAVHRAVRGAFLLFNLPLVAFLIPWRLPGHLPGWLVVSSVYPLYLWHSSAAFVFLLVAIREVFLLLLTGIRWVVRTTMGNGPVRAGFDPRRRVFVGRGMTVLAGAAFAGSALGAMGKDRFETTEQAVPIPNLPPEFEGFTIAFASDVHSSVFMTLPTMKRYVSALNEMHAGCIVVAGDFVNSTVDEVYPFAEAFSQLKAPHGVYGVLGNHDYYTRDVDAVAREVVGCGIRLLINERVLIEKGGVRLCVMGVDDTGKYDQAARWIDRSGRGIGGDIPKILLCHRPYYFDEAARRGIDLTLSGHTHGGQIVFARIGKDVIAPARIASPYVAGLYSIGPRRMYVSRGIGTVGIPVRLNCPPEITKITLVRAGGPRDS